MLRIHWYTEFRHRANQGEAEADSGSGREPGRQNGCGLGSWIGERKGAGQAGNLTEKVPTPAEFYKASISLGFNSYLKMDKPAKP